MKILFVVRRSALLSLSNDLEGFHLYGADLCLQGALAGRTAYVIDFHLTHLSAGDKSEAFFAAERDFRAKYAKALRSRALQTTCTTLFVSGFAPLHHAGQALLRAWIWAVRKRNRVIAKLKSALGNRRPAIFRPHQRGAAK